MWTNQYLKEEFYLKSKEERERIGSEYRQKGIERDNWQKDFVENRKFLNKFSDKKYELPMLREKRNRAYQERYNMGNGCFVEHGVELTRQHYLPGTLIIGCDVLLAKNVFIDYSGNLNIENNVEITDSVKVLTHHHPRHSSNNKTKPSIHKNDAIQSSLVIREDAVIGTGAIIMPSCNYIGKNARIGAGAVVTKDIPDFATAVGVPARVVKVNN